MDCSAKLQFSLHNYNHFRAKKSGKLRLAIHTSTQATSSHLETTNAPLLVPTHICTCSADTLANSIAANSEWCVRVLMTEHTIGEVALTILAL